MYGQKIILKMNTKTQKERKKERKKGRKKERKKERRRINDKKVSVSYDKVEHYFLLLVHLTNGSNCFRNLTSR